MYCNDLLVFIDFSLPCTINWDGGDGALGSDDGGHDRRTPCE